MKASELSIFKSSSFFTERWVVDCHRCWTPGHSHQTHHRTYAEACDEACMHWRLVHTEKIR